MASTAEMLAALQKAEAGNSLSSNEQHALGELAKVHDANGRRAQAITGANSTSDGKGILGI